MTRKNFWQLAATLLVLVLFVPFIFPPTGHDFTQDFLARAKNRDAAFSNIVEQFTAMQKTNAGRVYGNLKDAIGTNDLMKYFPQYTAAKNEKDPSGYILGRLQKSAAGKIRLGLDLQGGTRYLVTMDLSKLGTNSDRGTALSHGVEVIRRRVDSLGVAEPVIQALGEDRIDVQLPGLSESDKDRARALIQKAAFLEFRMVHPDSDMLIARDIPEAGYEVMKLEQKVKKDGREEKVTTRLLVNKKPELTGEHIKRADVIRDQFSNKPKITFELDKEGAKKFEQVTTEWQPKGGREYRLAIVLDGELRSAPAIKGVISNNGEISGDFDPKEAIDLKNTLENPLQAPVVIEEERSVDPTLGKDSIRSGVYASIFGTLGVALFMILFYFFAGAVANFALMLNVILTIGVMCALESTFTLPGIAGLVLSIGMAVDANVLIFERIREEQAAGKPLKSALAAGYSRAFGTILDSHVTTLISAMILAWLGTGPIKGFGVTLFFGVAISLFTALIVTRLIFDFALAKGLMKSLPMMPMMKLTKVDFLRFTKPAMAFSTVVILTGICYGVFARGQKMFGVDFAGGDSLTLEFKQRVETDKLREVIDKLGVGESTIQYQKPVRGGIETLSILASYNSEQKVIEALKKEFPEAGFNGKGVEKVGPKVGKEIQKSAIISALLAMFGILAYVAFRYEFSFAVAAVVATAHDALFTLGIFVMAGGQFSSAMVAAVLTIIGYSINDKIVILDRIREDLKLGVRGSFGDLINLALNQTLSRTLITGGSVILATLSLYIFGGGVIHDFAFTFLVGILAGTYSSLFIASAIVHRWNKGQRPHIGSGVSMESAAGVRAPATVRA